MAFAALVLCGCRGEVVHDPALEATARTLVASMVQGDWSTVFENLHSKVPVDEYGERMVFLWQRYFYAQKGGLEGINGVEIRRDGEYSIAYVRCAFARGDEVLRLTFEDDRLVGWLVGEPTTAELFRPYARLVFLLFALPPFVVLLLLLLRRVHSAAWPPATA